MPVEDSSTAPERRSATDCTSACRFGVLGCAHHRQSSPQAPMAESLVMLPLAAKEHLLWTARTPSPILSRTAQSS